jgi:hypothetical protein
MYDPENPPGSHPAILTYFLGHPVNKHFGYTIARCHTVSLLEYQGKKGGQRDSVTSTKSRDARRHAALSVLLVNRQHLQQRSSQVR